MKRQGGAEPVPVSRKKAQKSKTTPTTQGDGSNTSQLSDRQKHILYTFDVVSTYAEDLHLDASPEESGALLLDCRKMLPKLCESKIPISADTWTGLGRIRDGLVELAEKKFGVDNIFCKELKFDSLDSKKRGSLSRTMNMLAQNLPSAVAQMAISAVAIIKNVIK